MTFKSTLLLTMLACFAVIGAVLVLQALRPNDTASTLVEPHYVSAPARSAPPSPQTSTSGRDSAKMKLDAHSAVLWPPANYPPPSDASPSVSSSANMSGAGGQPAAQSSGTGSLPSAAAGTPATALPVQIRFHHINNVIQGTIVNVSKEELAVDVSLQQSGSQATLNLAPGLPTVFGARDGLELHAADQVTVRNGSYKDLVTTVR